ncbi:MAG: HypC/HybG/HupF family hydrogenase formation chaperone [Acidobacteriota bacterium]
MCLGIPGQVVSVVDSDGLRMGKVQFGGIVRDACLAYVPVVTPGDYVIVHAGFAISRVDEAEAARTYQLLEEMEQLAELEQAGTADGSGTGEPTSGERQ